MKNVFLEFQDITSGFQEIYITRDITRLGREPEWSLQGHHRLQAGGVLFVQKAYRSKSNSDGGADV